MLLAGLLDLDFIYEAAVPDRDVLLPVVGTSALAGPARTLFASWCCAASSGATVAGCFLLALRVVTAAAVDADLVVAGLSLA